MKRVLALDVGDKRIGAAISDPLGITAQPLATIKRDKDIWQNLEQIVHDKDVGIILIGLPRNMDGSLGEQARKTQEFAKALEKRLADMAIAFRDERLTTAASEQVLISAGMRREKRKLRRDAIAAALILQGYLDQKRFERERQSEGNSESSDK